MNGSRADIEVPDLKTIPIDRAAFSAIRDSVIFDPHARAGIGTYKEKKLHLFLKKYFVPDESKTEIPFRGFICDGKDDDRITEIMTVSLSGLNGKLAAFLPDHRVNIVFPLITEKRLIWVDPETGESTSGRISPRKDRESLLLAEFCSIIDHLSSRNLFVTAVKMKVDEYRLLNGRGPAGKIGAEKLYKIPSEFISVTEYKPEKDIGLFFPESLTGKFTRNEFATAARLKGRKLSSAIKVLERTGVIVDTNEGNRPRYFEKVR